MAFNTSSVRLVITVSVRDVLESGRMKPLELKTVVEFRSVTFITHWLSYAGSITRRPVWGKQKQILKTVGNEQPGTSS